MAQAEMAPPFGLTGARRVFAIAFAAFTLTGFFVMTGFPYDRVTPRITTAIEAMTGARVSIGRLGVGVAWLAPQLRAWDVDVAWPGGQRARVDRLRVQPAWSFAWLRGRPAFFVAIRSPLGELDGTFVASDRPGFDGELRGVELKQLPIGEYLGGASLDGRVDATIDVVLAEAGPEGSARFDVAKGSMSLPGLPIGVPFESLHGDLTLGGDALVEIGALDLVGPLVGFSAKGTVGKAATATLAPLAIDATLDVREPTVGTLLRGQGVTLDAQGKAQLTIGGTLGAPQPQPQGQPARAAGRR
jgi:type II secretion system protein N